MVSDVKRSYSGDVSILPFPFFLVLAFLFGWAIWDRWLSTAATIVLFGLLLFAVGTENDARAWALLGFNFALELPPRSGLTSAGPAFRNDARGRRRLILVRLARAVSRAGGLPVAA